jgi:thiamine biosynthesis lipoprotein
MHLVELDPKNFTISFARPGVMLDLGAIGKGYAIDQAADILREAGVSRALIHGGTSTVYAIGSPWKVGIESDKEDPIAVVDLEDTALSVSAVWGKSFRVGKKTYGHVIDPRTGRPVQRALLAAVILPCATETDALSTALLTLGRTKLNSITRLRPGMRALVLDPECSIATRGIGPHKSAVVDRH